MRTLLGAAALVAAVGALGLPAASPSGASGPVTQVVSADLGAPTALTIGGVSTDYSYLYRNADGTPARFNPCRTIHWRVNAAGAPLQGGRDIAEAFKRISAATGITFVRDGRTSILPDGRTFSGWGTTDIVIGYATPAQRAFLGGAVVGQGGAQLTLHPGNRWQIAKGYVVLDRIDLARHPAGWGAGNTQGAIYLHELAHAIGLGHARALPQVMYGRGSSKSVPWFQKGDLAGLAKLGRKAGCVTTRAIGT